MVETGSDSDVAHKPVRQRTRNENESVSTQIRDESPQIPLQLRTKRITLHKKAIIQNVSWNFPLHYARRHMI